MAPQNCPCDGACDNCTVELTLTARCPPDLNRLLVWRPRPLRPLAPGHPAQRFVALGPSSLASRELGPNDTNRAGVCEVGHPCPGGRDRAGA